MHKITRRSSNSLKSLKRKGGLPGLSVIISFIIALVLVLLIINYMVPSVKNGWSLILETLGFGKSADEFSQEISSLAQKVSEAPSEEKKIAIYQQMIVNWEKFSESRNSKSIDSDTKNEIMMAYTYVLRHEIDDFRTNGCDDHNKALAKIQDGTYPALCLPFFDTYVSAKNSLGVSFIAKTKEEYETIDLGIGALGLIIDSYSKVPVEAERQKICPPMLKAMVVCEDWDSVDINGYTLPSDSACSEPNQDKYIKAMNYEGCTATATTS